MIRPASQLSPAKHVVRDGRFRAAAPRAGNGPGKHRDRELREIKSAISVPEPSRERANNFAVVSLRVNRYCSRSRRVRHGIGSAAAVSRV